ncbi:hypothetical protein FGB62_88g012 [Gracilaria domingensis]|nr:hypothetical protein FGB62_88g012 [Gracilaria domingensis]
MAAPSGCESEVFNAVREFHFAIGNLPEDLKPDESPDTDSGRAFLLGKVFDTGLVSFAHWDYDEICAFLFCTYPKYMFRDCCRIAGGSKFVEMVYINWQPPFELYACAMWEYTKRDAVLFGHWLYLLPNTQRPSKQEMGKVLFSTMLVSGMLTEDDCASIAGALILYPQETMYAREHEQEIDKYSLSLEPCEVGLLCRSLLIHRATERFLCTCNYRDRSNDMVRCECADINGEQDMPHIKLVNDLDKDYATVIFQLILERHHYDAVAFDRRWSQENRDDFLRSACEYVFCQEVYTEIYRKLHCGRRPRVEQRNPRTLTESESPTSVSRTADPNYDPNFGSHNGCVVPSCRQSTKKECANVSCRTHCIGLGYHRCNAHRSYCPHPGPNYHPRRGIEFIPDHLGSNGETGVPPEH